MPVLPAQSRQALRTFVGAPGLEGRGRKEGWRRALLWERCLLRDSPPIHNQSTNVISENRLVSWLSQVHQGSQHILKRLGMPCYSICSGLDLALLASGAPL